MDNIYPQNALESNEFTIHVPLNPLRSPLVSLSHQTYQNSPFADAILDHRNTVQPVAFLCTPIPTTKTPTSHGTSQKRKDKDIFSVNETPDPPPKRRKSPKSIAQKLEVVLLAINKDASWTFSKFLYHVFWWRDENGMEISRNCSHAHCVQRFLGGTSLHTPGQIIKSWVTSKDGRKLTECITFSRTKNIRRRTLCGLHLHSKNERTREDVSFNNFYGAAKLDHVIRRKPKAQLRFNMCQ
jgi:hypothetical protein